MKEKSLFNWQRFPKISKIISGFVEAMVGCHKGLALIKKELLGKGGLRLFDHIDYITPGYGEITTRDLYEWGFVNNENFFSHPGGIFPGIVLAHSHSAPRVLAIRVESIAKFLAVKGLQKKINGKPHHPVRDCLVSTVEGIDFRLVERSGSMGLPGTRSYGDTPGDFYRVKENWYNRPRLDDASLTRLTHMALTQVGALGRDRAAHLFFQAERYFWKIRNRAAQGLCNHLDALGLGLAGHDHHTYRSSRSGFPQLINFFEILGFHCRERFYAGEEAGWGAQVMENPRIGVTLFLDVDLAPGELDVDFVGQGLATSERLGTVGLWCALHGDSIGSGGLHHLALRADFDGLTAFLATQGISFMPPFSGFPYLKQAFSRGETWEVPVERVKSLQKNGHIDKKIAQAFLTQGAIGSHLENIQRDEGYKGFSQKEVSKIIKQTDPSQQNK